MTEKKKITQQLITLAQRGTFRELADSLPGNDVVLLAIIARHTESGDGKIRMTTISREMNISKPAATQAVSRLCRHGFVVRETGSDRRTICVSITPEGEKYYKRRITATEKAVAGIIDRMGEENAGTFFRLFDSFADALAPEEKD